MATAVVVLICVAVSVAEVSSAVTGVVCRLVPVINGVVDD